MFKLSDFNHEEELKFLINDNFKLNNEDSCFYLNEEDDKIWSYSIKNGQERNTLILQINRYSGKIYIDFQADNYSEEIRVKASEIAHYIRKILLQKTNEEILFDELIIKSMEDYEKTLSQENIDNLKNVLKHLFSDEYRKKSCFKFMVFGLEGESFPHIFPKGTLSTFEKGNDGIHSFEIFISKESKKFFLDLTNRLGYSVIEIDENKNPFENVNLNELFQQGLIEVEIEK